MVLIDTKEKVFKLMDYIISSEHYNEQELYLLKNHCNRNTKITVLQNFPEDQLDKGSLPKNWFNEYGEIEIPYREYFQHKGWVSKSLEELKEEFEKTFQIDCSKSGLNTRYNWCILKINTASFYQGEKENTAEKNSEQNLGQETEDCNDLGEELE